MVLLGRGSLVFVGSDLFLYLFCWKYLSVSACWHGLALVVIVCFQLCLFTGIWAVVTVPSFNAHLAGYSGNLVTRIVFKI